VIRRPGEHKVNVGRHFNHHKHHRVQLAH
jgi:hypothetical protein